MFADDDTQRHLVKEYLQHAVRPLVGGHGTIGRVEELPGVAAGAVLLGQCGTHLKMLGAAEGRNKIRTDTSFTCTK